MANTQTKSIEGQQFEDRGFTRIPNSGGIYWKMNSTEIVVVRLGTAGYKCVDYDYAEMPSNPEDRDEWAATEALMIASNREFEWKKD